MKPHILVDVDGVLANFTKAALDHLQALTGHCVNPEVITSWEVFDSVPEELRGWKDDVYLALKAPGGCSAIPVYEDAQVGMARLSEHAEVTIVTSPFNGSKTWMHEREQWLEKYFGIHHRNVVHADKKFRVHGDFFLDDKPDHVHQWCDYWIGMGRDTKVQPILWDSPRSANDIVGAGVLRAKSWDDVITAVASR